MGVHVEEVMDARRRTGKVKERRGTLNTNVLRSVKERRGARESFCRTVQEWDQNRKFLEPAELLFEDMKEPERLESLTQSPEEETEPEQLLRNRKLQFGTSC